MKRDIFTAIRQNHALEHATIEILMGKLGSGARLMGIATTDGFHVYGDVTTEAVTQAANEGLARLKRGEHNLAVSPLCGTNLVTAGVLAGLASMIAMKGKNGIDQLLRVILAATTAVVLARPLGRLAQKHITTIPNLDDVDIAEVTCKRLGKYTFYKIRTVQD